MSGLQIYLLGAPRFKLEEKQLSLGRRKVIALLAYLAVSGRPHNRDSLATLFWPEYDQSGARANLRRDISRLRKAVGDTVLKVEGEQVGLSSDYPIWVDVQEFQKLVDQINQHGHTLRTDSTPLCDTCAQTLTEAVQLYQDDFMAGFSLVDSAPYDDWQFFQNEELRQMIAEVLQHLIYWHTSAGRFERAVEYARRWVKMDPLHELAHQQLMKLYFWSGQHAAALRQYQDLERNLKHELKIEPDEETKKLFRKIQSRELETPLAVDARTLTLPELTIEKQTQIVAHETTQTTLLRSNLPTQNTPFVGRQEEISRITQLLTGDPPTRLITLLGPGGSGKTRLAIQTAREFIIKNQHHFPDGVWFIALVQLNESDSIPSAISQIINYCPQNLAENLDKQLVEYLKNRKMLLVLDNIEHLVSAESQRFLSEILNQAPGISMLVTSRVRLNVRSEYLISVEGLSLPPGKKRIIEDGYLEYSALQLFQHCAERIRPNFQLSPSNLEAVRRICELVQGMPLGIELAAAWIEMFQPEEIAAEIQRSLDFLEVDWHGMPERQHSLRAVFNGSWQLLTEQEKQAVTSLSVFTGSFSREAAQNVSGVSIKLLQGLVHKSWLQHDSARRFAIHEQLRQYAHQILEENENGYHQARMRHATYYADYLFGQNQAMQTRHQREAFDQVRDEFENLRTAWDWLIEKKQFELLVFWLLPGLFRYCETRKRAPELLPLISNALQSLETDSHEYSAKQMLSILLTAQGAFFTNGYPVRYESFGMMVPANQKAIERAWSLFELPKNKNSMNLDYWAITLSYLYGRILDRQAGIQVLENLLNQYNDLDRSWSSAFCQLMLAQLHELNLASTEEKETTNDYLINALETFVELGDEREAGHTLRSLGNLRRFQDRYDQAIECWESAQRKLQLAGDWSTADDIHWQIGDMYLDIGQVENAFEHYRIMSQSYITRGYYSIAGQLLSKESYEALRYGYMERAWETRQLSLKYSRMMGDTFGEAWNIWELGEYYVISEEYPAARQAFDEALHLFKQVNDPTGYIFFHRGMGEVAFRMDDYYEALRQFELSLEYAQKSQHQWAQAYAQTCIGRTQLKLADIEAATQNILPALRVAQTVGHRALIHHVLAGAAELYAVRGENQQATETAAFLSKQDTTWSEDKSRMNKLLRKLEQKLEKDDFQRAMVAGQQRSLEEFNLV